MLKLIHLNYHCHTEFSEPAQVIEKHRLSSGFIKFLKDRVNFISIKHLNYNGKQIMEGVPYHFFRSRNKFWWIPLATHRFIRSQKPDAVFIEGFVFPLQIIFLRLLLGKKVAFIVQHHGEKPFKGWKGFIQRIAGTFIHAFAFTSIDNAGPWLEKKVIRDAKNCFEILSASTEFIPKEKSRLKSELGFCGHSNFLWVGRLNSNKDPLTVLEAFGQYAKQNTEAKFYMIYQTEELLAEITNLIEQNEVLKKAVVLVGEKTHTALEAWFNAADYFISGSHSEGSGYALVEAMACGCIPVVTAIPSFKNITSNGAFGLLYEPGSAAYLLNKLLLLPYPNAGQLSKEIINHAADKLSCKTIADQVYTLCHNLLKK